MESSFGMERCNCKTLGFYQSFEGRETRAWNLDFLLIAQINEYWPSIKYTSGVVNFTYIVSLSHLFSDTAFKSLNSCPWIIINANIFDAVNAIFTM